MIRASDCREGRLKSRDFNLERGMELCREFHESRSCYLQFYLCPAGLNIWNGEKAEALAETTSLAALCGVTLGRGSLVSLRLTCMTCNLWLYGDRGKGCSDYRKPASKILQHPSL